MRRLVVFVLLLGAALLYRKQRLDRADHLYPAPPIQP